jgi:hypothetical protein
MRTPEAIRESIQAIEAKEMLLEQEKKAYYRELFEASFIMVSWEEAEAIFFEMLTVDSSWTNGPIVSKGYGTESSRAHVVDNNGKLQLWIGGYEHKDNYRRGEFLYVDRNYADRIPERGEGVVDYLNRKNTPLPKKECIIKLKRDDADGEKVYVCKWKPFFPHNYTEENMPAEGYLGTASVIQGRYEGIGFHAWEQNESEFIYYSIIV